MILVIFGAGASYDSLASLRPRPKIVHESRPPLADELFSGRRIVDKALAEFSECYPIVPYLQSAPKNGQTIENALEGLEREAETDPERKRQMAAIRYYLQTMIGECERRWHGVTRGVTNHLTLLDQLRRMRHPEEPVCLVTFNYDCLIERALGWKVENISEYIAHDDFELFKLHGSVDWGREIDTPEIDISNNRNVWQVARELIHKADELTISTKYRVVNQRPIAVSDGVALFPAIAVPVETKSGFECPEDHLDRLRHYLPKITKVILIGWRATDQHFLGVLEELLPKSVPLYAVAADRRQGEDVIERIEGADVLVDGRASEVGFSDFVVSREAERFLLTNTA